MVKILGICGSPRRKAAYTALKAAMESAKEQGDVEIEIVELRARKMNFCVHCNKCLRDNSDRCTLYEDDMTELYDKFFEADGVIIASPVYEMNVTAQLATFFGRFRSSWMISVKDPYFFMRKVGAAIAVGGTRNGGQESTISAILNFYNTQGITICNGGSGIYAGASCWNPGDGSGTFDDPMGIENAKALGKKVAIMTKIMKEANIPEA
ncbi:MAG: flavodoxin family protein [Eubacterium sp.]|nr:flavodoxin family protein [Eubacterium sp.]